MKVRHVRILHTTHNHLGAGGNELSCSLSVRAKRLSAMHSENERNLFQGVPLVVRVHHTLLLDRRVVFDTRNHLIQCWRILYVTEGPFRRLPHMLVDRRCTPQRER